MSDPKLTSPDKQKKNRSFGSFLLFLTVLVAILAYVSSREMRRPRELTQDQYLAELYLGNVDSQGFRGQNLVEGQLKSGERFSVRFAGLREREADLQELKAVRTYQPIQAEALLRGVSSGAYEPQLARVVTTYREKVTPGETPEAPKITSTEREDHLLVRVAALSEQGFAAASGGALGGFPLLERSGTLWLRVDQRELGDLPRLLGALSEAGARTEFRALDVSENKGSNWEDTSNMLSSVLLVFGPWLLILFVFLFFMRQMRNQGAAGGVMSFGRSRAQLYNKESHTNTTFSDVAGADEAKDEVREVVEFLKNPGRFTRIGGRIPRGILLVGPPGCGKTLLAKAIAGEAEVPFYSISGSDFVEMFVGVGASRVRDLFKQARENSPCIIFLDEIDAVGRRRGSGMGGGHDEREQTLNAILVEMDGFGTDEGIIVLAATNRPDVLDPALLRPGRFDREVTIDLPDVQGRAEILSVHLKKVKHDDSVDVQTLARSTPGYSGADLAATVNEAAIMAALQKSEVIRMEHLEEARDKVRYGRQKKSRKFEEEDRRITAYHEAGHAVVAIQIPETDPPHKVTIVPRGRALGSTMVLPEKESYHMQRKRLVGQLAVLFGGRVSEALFCGDISAGASDDIRRATELARAMVTELGMSDRIGPVNYAERQGSDFLGTELLSGKWHSEVTAREIDEEVKQLLSDAYERAQRLVEGSREQVEILTSALLKYETITGEEIGRILRGASIEDLRPEPLPESPRPRVEGPSKRQEKGTRGTALPGELGGEPGLSPA